MCWISHTTKRGRYADGAPFTLLAPRYEIVDRAFGRLPADVQISPRVAPAVFGVGLLEAIPERTIMRRADPGDRDGDGISGRPNRVPDARSEATVLSEGDAAKRRPRRIPDSHATALGRFGWKANVRPSSSRTPLAVPARREVADATTSAGERRFAEIGCDACHLPELKTGSSDVGGLREQLIRPYTDLLLHDMGAGLADGRPDGLASGSEWRTAPLWGIGLVQTVNRHTRFLHDGRARNLEEAILWHGGEARAAGERFRTLAAPERRQLIAFLESL